MVSLPARHAARESESDTRTRLLRAAGPVFATHGFDGATVREICATANVNIASVGYYFGDKLGLYREVIQGVRDERERRFPVPDNSTADPRQTLYKIVHTLLSRMMLADRSGWETQLMMREMQHPTPVFDSIVREFFRPLFDRLVQTIERLIGSIHTNTHPRAVGLQRRGSMSLLSGRSGCRTDSDSRSRTRTALRH